MARLDSGVLRGSIFGGGATLGAVSDWHGLGDDPSYSNPPDPSSAGCAQGQTVDASGNCVGAIGCPAGQVMNAGVCQAAPPSTGGGGYVAPPPALPPAPPVPTPSSGFSMSSPVVWVGIAVALGAAYLYFSDDGS